MAEKLLLATEQQANAAGCQNGKDLLQEDSFDFNFQGNFGEKSSAKSKHSHNLQEQD
jgi:hypothetical protein